MKCELLFLFKFYNIDNIIIIKKIILVIKIIFQTISYLIIMQAIITYPIQGIIYQL